jgi:hypothetical protein
MRVEAIESQNIINFVSLAEEEFKNEESLETT